MHTVSIMDITVSSSDNLTGTLVLPIWKGETSLTDPKTAGMPQKTKEVVSNVLSSGNFEGKAGATLTLFTATEQTVLLVGMGPRDDADLTRVRHSGAAAIVARTKAHGNRMAVRLSGMNSIDAIAFVEGMMLRDYAFDKYLTSKEEEDPEGPMAIDVQVEDAAVETVTEAIESLKAIVPGVHLARDLGNEPPNHLYPKEYARRATKWAEDHDHVNVTVINYEAALELGMGGLVAVGKGSERKPCMVIFDINPSAGNQPPVIVGKGITFDTGGISIKPSAKMDEMKYDMHGSATVFGLMHAVAASGWGQRVVGIACMAENMPDGTATRPGDVITTFSGKTVEVLNTDAEGRLVLADGLWKSGEFDPAYIVDLATLTGAVIYALSHEASGLWSNDDALADRLTQHGLRVGEPVWRMPLYPVYEKDMKDTKYADLKNISGHRGAGSSTAAAFLKQFVPNRGYAEDGTQIPWAHLDIAGTAWGVKSNKLVPYGGTGVHVRTLFDMITKPI